MKCSDIDDVAMLKLIPAPGEPWGILWDIEEACGHPYKLVRAKLKGLIKRGLITGCACGCRGDFNLTEKGVERLAQPKVEGFGL